MTTGQKRISINRDIDASMKRLVTVQRMNDFMDDALPVLQVACYLRVSTSAQTTENQLIELMKDNGFSNTEYRNLSGGVSAIHSGWKI